MKKEINFGIGFITGRPNVCEIINHYYKYILEQVEELDTKVNFTFYILYDLNYMNTKAEDFYKIDPEVHEYITIKYLTPECVMQEKKTVMEKHNLTQDEANLLIGTGYAKARNSILYQALTDHIDYLLFWDDDEYPLASIKDRANTRWLKQKNVLQHIKYIEDADITYGYRCGLMNPFPFVEYSDIITESVYRDFIKALENDVVSWNKAQYMLKNESGIEYADEQIALGNSGLEEVHDIGINSVAFGSGICLNLSHLDKIPAFYNPPEARGEDTFFSCTLAYNGAKVLKIPTYHFHDGFLKYKFLMDDKFPNKLRKITSKDDEIESRFLKTAIGWTRYKPLLYYIWDKNTYRETMDEAKQKFRENAAKVSTAFKNCDLTCLADILEKYDKNVEKHYKEYMDTNKIWDKIKFDIKRG